MGKVGTGLIRRKQCYSVQRWVKKRREILLSPLFTVRATQQYTRILKLQKKKNASHVCYHTPLSVPFVSRFFSPTCRKFPPSGFLDELSLQVFRCCTTSLQRVPQIEKRMIEKQILHLLQTFTRSPHPLAGLYVAVFNSCKRADNVSCRHQVHCGSRALSKTRGRRERRERRRERRGYVAATTSAWRKEGKRRAKAASL